MGIFSFLDYSSYKNTSGKIVYFVMINALNLGVIFIIAMSLATNLKEFLFFMYAISLFVIFCYLLYRNTKRTFIVTSLWVIIWAFINSDYMEAITDMIRFCWGWYIVYLGFILLKFHSILYCAKKIPLRILIYHIIVINAITIGLNILSYGERCAVK